MIEQFGLPSRGRRNNPLEMLPQPQIVTPNEPRVRGNESVSVGALQSRQTPAAEALQPEPASEMLRQSEPIIASGIPRTPDSLPRRGGGLAGALLAGTAGIALSALSSMGRGIHKAGAWITERLDKVLDRGIHKTQDFVFRKVPQFLKRTIRKLFGLDKGNEANQSSAGPGSH